ncbi:MAG: Electron transfer DM13 domain protein [Parcubacteria group bacterium GW2011_GWC1_45_14]|nr:MAG: Electron transfer DM13 domain protein [Parcubacteria group bacterium GW2011_GWC1_45_14]
MMKNIILIFSAVIALGVAYWLISPLFITRTVNEEIPFESADVAQDGFGEDSADQQKDAPSQEILQGNFEGRAGHSASGTVKIIEAEGKKYVRFESDFKITNGPDLFVHFGKDGKYAAGALLGALKGNEGSQNYEIPSEMDISNFDEVWVWCRAFSVPFGVCFQC